MAKKYFISASFDTDISPVISILHQSGIKPVLSSDIPFTSGSSASMLSNAISDSDIFIAVLSETPASTGVLFEAGMAVGLGKPVLVIAPRNVIIPDQLSSAAVVHAPLEDAQTLKFAVDTLQKAPKQEQRVSRRRHTKGKVLGQKANVFKVRLDALRTQGSPADFEALVADLLKAAGVHSVVSSRHGDDTADLAIWVDELSPILGNPLLVEVKAKVQSVAAARKAAHALLRFLNQTTSRNGLVIYDAGIPQSEAQLSEPTAQILFFQLDALLEQLASHSFASVVRSTRNSLIHRGKA